MSGVTVRITAEVEIDAADYPDDEDEVDLMSVRLDAEAHLSLLGVVLGEVEVEEA